MEETSKPKPHSGAISNKQWDLGPYEWPLRLPKYNTHFHMAEHFAFDIVAGLVKPRDAVFPDFQALVSLIGPVG